MKSKMNHMKFICCLMVAACIAACGGEKTPTGPSVPDVPTGLKLHSTGDDSFTFQWDPMEGAISYDWQLLSETNSVLLNGNVTKRNVTVSPVDKGVNYGFRVRSVNEEGSSDWCASVAAKIVDQFRGKKVVAFHMHRRKGYRRTKGHRQSLTRVEITGIQG